MITDEQIIAKSLSYDEENNDGGEYLNSHFELGARWMRVMTEEEISTILINCYMLSTTCKGDKKKVVLEIDVLLEQFKKHGYEPILPF